jgi:hypothetical protein
VGLLVVINILESKRVNTKIQAESYRCRVLKQSETGSKSGSGSGPARQVKRTWKLQRTSNVGEEETPALSRRHPSPWSPRAVRLAAPEGARLPCVWARISNLKFWMLAQRDSQKALHKKAGGQYRPRKAVTRAEASSCYEYMVPDPSSPVLFPSIPVPALAARDSRFEMPRSRGWSG